MIIVQGRYSVRGTCVFWMLHIILAMTGSMVIGNGTVSNAFNRHITEDPTKTVEKFLSLDKKGVRLEASTWQAVGPYVDWEEALVWGHVVVIENFHIVEDVTQWEIASGLEAKIPVVFDVLGTMYWESVTFIPDPHQESQMFHIKAVHDRWQIVDPQLPPHVGLQRLMDFVRWMELSEPEATRKASLASLHKQLKAQ